MKLLLDKPATDFEFLENDISKKWLDFFDELHESGKENEFNEYAEKCWEGETVSLEEFNNWFDEEEDLIKESLEMSDETEEDEYEDF